MSLSIRSKLLVFLGRRFYGEPSNFGVPCSAEEFYCLPAERSSTNKVNLHPSVVSSHDNMKRNAYVNQMRLVATKHLAILGTIIAVTLSGSLMLRASTIQSLNNKYESWKVQRQVSKSIEESKSSSTVAASAIELEKLKGEAQTIQETAEKLQEKVQKGDIPAKVLDDFLKENDSKFNEINKRIKELGKSNQESAPGAFMRNM